MINRDIFKWPSIKFHFSDVNGPFSLLQLLDWALLEKAKTKKELLIELVHQH